MSEFIPDPVKPVYIYVGAMLRDMLGGTYRVESVTDEHFDVRSVSPALVIPEWLTRPGVIRYRWDEPCPLRSSSDRRSSDA